MLGSFIYGRARFTGTEALFAPHLAWDRIPHPFAGRPGIYAKTALVWLPVGDRRGLQAVLVNLRLDCEAARRLGVETHVCELQLLLKPLAAQVNMQARGRLSFG